MIPPVINIGFGGLGTVGQGVGKHLSANRAQLDSVREPTLSRRIGDFEE